MLEKFDSEIKNIVSNEEKKNNRCTQNKGITLVALVITIIIIIILATVAINLAFGNNGLITQAQRAKLEQEIATARETLTMILGDAFVEKKTNPEYDQDEFLDEFIKEREPNVYLEEDEIGLDGHVFSLNRSVPELGEYIGEQTGPRIKEIKVTGETTNSVSIEVLTVNATGAEYTYSYKKDSEGEESWQEVETSNNNTCTINGLTQGETYNVKVVVTTKDGSAEGTINVYLGEIPTGTITFTNLNWVGDGTASVQINTTAEGYRIRYKIDSGEWIETTNGGTISNLQHGNTVYGQLWDGTNNSGEEDATVTIIDDIPPAISNITTSVTENSITVNVTASDSQSGIANYTYRIKESSQGNESYTTPENASNITSNTYTFTGLNSSTTYTMQVTVTDKGGQTVQDSTQATTSEPPEPVLIDTVLPTAPKLSDGMTPVKWSETKQKWIKTTTDNWYAYQDKKWANIVLTPDSGANAGKDATGAVDVFNIDGTLNEDSAYTMLVWIPRYAYQITTQYHTSTASAGNINIVFIDTNNQNKEKTTTYSETYPNATAGANSGMGNYVVHPAFNYGGTKLSGFWVGKYETSHTECTTDSSTGSNNTDVSTLKPMIKAGVTSWRNIQESNIFTVCINMNSSGNPYGLNTSDSVVDPHMMKNSEWGAVAYLSQNTTYGKGSEVWKNNSSTYITGNAGSSVIASSASGVTNAYNTTNGQQASTNRKCNRSI